MRFTKQETLQIIAEIKNEIKLNKIEYKKSTNDYDRQYWSKAIDGLYSQLRREEGFIEIMDSKNITEMSFAF